MVRKLNEERVTAKKEVLTQTKSQLEQRVKDKTSGLVPLVTAQKKAKKTNFETVMNYKNETSLADIPENIDEERSQPSNRLEEKKESEAAKSLDSSC